MALSLELTNTYNCRFFVKRFPVCFNIFVLLFLVTPCLVVALQLWIESNPIKKSVKTVFFCYTPVCCRFSFISFLNSLNQKNTFDKIE